MFDTSRLNPMQKARLEEQLDKLMRFSDGMRTVRAQLLRLAAGGPLVRTVGDGFIDYNRVKFNRMDGKQQRAYEDKLRAKRYYYVNDWQVAKIVFDAVIGDVTRSGAAANDPE